MFLRVPSSSRRNCFLHPQLRWLLKFCETTYAYGWPKYGSSHLCDHCTFWRLMRSSLQRRTSQACESYDLFLCSENPFRAIFFLRQNLSLSSLSEFSSWISRSLLINLQVHLLSLPPACPTSAPRPKRVTRKQRGLTFEDATGRKRSQNVY